MKKTATLSAPVPDNPEFSYENGQLRFVDAKGERRVVNIAEAVSDSVLDLFHYWDQSGNEYTINPNGQVTELSAPDSTKR